MKQIFLILTILLMSANWCIAKHLHPEKYYQEFWCAKFNGVQEYELYDKTRVDCLTKDYAVEVDFAKKWAECVGQALYYGLSTNKKPACLIIIEQPNDFRYFKRIKKLSKTYNLNLWYIKAPEYTRK